MSSRLEAKHVYKVVGRRPDAAVERLRQGADREELCELLVVGAHDRASRRPARARRRRSRRMRPCVRKGSGQPHRRTRLRRSGCLLSGSAAQAYDAPRTRSRCAEGAPDITSVHGGTVELTGHRRARCDTDRELRATLKDFTTWHATPRPVAGPSPGLMGHARRHRRRCAPRTRWRTTSSDGKSAAVECFGSWRTYAYDPTTGRADRLTIRTHGGSRAFATPSATPLTAPDGHPALLVSPFVPREGVAPGESGQLVYWREL